MKEVLGRLAGDFFSTLLFLGLWLLTGNVIMATALAIAGAVAQIVYAKFKGQQLGFMTWASLGLVVVLGGATLLTDDPRFVLAKPSIAHFAIGIIMLRRDWMLRYVPPIVSSNIPGYVTTAGYVWAALMFATGVGVIVTAGYGDMKLWVLYVSLIAPAIKIAAFAIQFVIFRLAIGQRLRAARLRSSQPAGTSAPLSRGSAP